jgi:hypothetical protein
MANMTVDHKFRRIVPPDVKVGFQQAGKKIASSDMEIAVAQGDAWFHRE